MDLVDRMFAPALDWAGDVMEALGLPRDGQCRVRRSVDGTWSICPQGHIPELPGETIGGPMILDRSNRDLKLASQILFEIRRYRTLRQRGEHDHAAYTVARLAERLAETPIQDYRSRGGRESGKRQGDEKVARVKKALEIYKSLSAPERERAGIIARRLGLTATSIRTYLREAGIKTKRR